MEFCRFLRSVKFVVRSLGRYLGRGVCLWLRWSHGSCIKKVGHFLAFVVKIGVVAAEASQSEKLREWDDIFLRVVDERTNVASSYENQLVCCIRLWINRCR